MKFLRENWAWIVVPIVLFAVVVLGVVLFGSGESLDPHGYNLR